MLELIRREAQARAMDAQASRAAATAMRVRFFAVCLFLPLLAVMHWWGGPGWDTYLAAVATFGVFATALFVFRRSPAVMRVAPFLFVLDVLLVFEVQRRSLPGSPFPAGVAGFSLGLFAMLIVMSGSTMRRSATWVVTLAAVPAQLALMSLAGVSPGAQLTAAMVLVTITLTQTGVSSSLRRIVYELASAEAAWRREHEQVTELTEARGTIERLLVEARSQNAQLVALQVDKDSLTSLLVHDLRAPLGAVRANLDWVKGELPKDFDDEVVSALTEARQVTDRLAGMIGDLLNITRLESGALPLERAAQPCRALLESLHRQLQAQGRNRRITVEMDCEDVVLEADHALVMRTLENVSSNALRYTPTGGRIRIEGRRDRGEVVFSVRNDGPIIPASVRTTLFDKYVQAGSTQDNRRAGWGLGLYFCKLCVDAHGGTIGVVDQPGWATSFELRIPGVVPTLMAA